MRVRRRVVFRKMDKHYGCTWIHPKEPILINLSLHERRIPSRTYWHEALHHVFPEKSERDIRALEEETWRKLTAKQRFLLSKKLFNRSWRTK